MSKGESDLPRYCSFASLISKIKIEQEMIRLILGDSSRPTPLLDTGTELLDLKANTIHLRFPLKQ